MKNESDMVYRMGEYRMMIERRYRLPVKQYVIYIGEGLATMISSLTSEGLHYEYSLISFSEIPYQLFLRARYPEERLLAVLANFGEDAPETVITEILQKVRSTAKGDFAENQHLQQLRILIQLRNLTTQFDLAMEKISKFFKEEKDPFFQKGVQRGLEQGIERGIEQGIEQGIDLKSHAVVHNLITKLGLSDEQAASVAEVSVEFVREIRSSLVRK